MKTQIPCDHCDGKADEKFLDWPSRLCEVCWLKFYGQPKVKDKEKNG